MTARVVNLDSAHREVRDLLPWFVMGTLDEAEQRLVDEHLKACAACRGELEWERQLRDANRVALPERDVDRAFAALRARLPAQPREAPLFERLRDLGERLLSPAWLRPMLALQAAAIVGLAVALWAGRMPAAAQEHTYRALSRPAAAEPARVVVAFTPQTSLGEMRRILLASDARVVDGPTAADAYILAIAPERLDAAVQRLRGESSVLLVQPLEAKAAQ